MSDMMTSVHDASVKEGVETMVFDDNITFEDEANTMKDALSDAQRADLEQNLKSVMETEKEITESANAPSEEEPAENPTEAAAQTPERPKMVYNPNMYIYFDCEFTKLSLSGQLLSIGLIDAQGHTFYAEFTDFNYADISDWVFDNVIKNMTRPPRRLSGDYWSTRGDRKQVREDLLLWLDAVRKHTGCPGIQFVSDCCHYDMVFLIDLLWGNAMDIPTVVCPYCVDINEEMGTLIAGVVHKDDYVSTNVHLGPMYNPYMEAFRLSREEQVKDMPNRPVGIEHNALFDAKVIRCIHQQIQQLNVPFTPLSALPR